MNRLAVLAGRGREDEGVQRERPEERERAVLVVDDHVRAGCDRLVPARVARGSIELAISSSLKPGPAGFVSPWISRTRSAR